MPTRTSTTISNALVAQFQAARTTADAERVIAAVMREMPDATWRAVGDRPNNAGTVEIASNAASALIERVTNAIDGVLELGAAGHHGATPTGPRAAAREWFGVPAGGIADMSVTRRRALAERIRVTLHDSSERTRPTVRVVDRGIGQHPSDVAMTLLSLNESNKVGKAYLGGAYGQGSSATYRFGRYTIIITRRAPQTLADDQQDLVGATIVWQDPGDPARDKLPTYKYLVDAHGDVPAFAPARLTDPDWHGVDVVHVAYDLRGFTGAYNQPKNGVWALFHAALFDPVLPFLVGGDRAVDGDAAGAGTTRVVIGNRARLDGPDGPRGDLRVAHASSVALDVGKALGEPYGEVDLRYWVLTRSAESTSTSDPTASYTTADAAISITQSGQRQDAIARSFVKLRVGLPMLSKCLIAQIDVDRLTPLGRRQLFSSTRERAVDGPLRDAIHDLVAQALSDDSDLRRLEREERERLLGTSDEVVDEKIRARLAKHINTKLRDRVRTVRKDIVGPPPPGPGGERAERDTDDTGLPPVPTTMRFEKPAITVRRGASTTVWVSINARNGYLPEHLDALSVAFDATTGGKLTDISKSELLGGRTLWRLQAAPDAPLGTTTVEAVLVTPDGVLHASCAVTVADAPARRRRTQVVEEPEQGPQIKWITEDGWSRLGWTDARVVGEVHASDEATVIYVNRHQRLLTKAVDGNRRLGTEAVNRRANRYLLPVACALYEQHRAVAGGQTVEDSYVVGEMERLAEAVLLIMDQDALDDD